MKVYTASSISGMTTEEAFNYFENIKTILNLIGYTVFTPLAGKGYLRTEEKFKAKDYRNPISTNNAIL